MKLTSNKDSEDSWTISLAMTEDETRDFVLETRGQVYNFIRAARMLGVEDDQIAISRVLSATYSFEGD